LQLLDNGTLEDKYTEETVPFKDTIIILTTNAGRSLYDDPNAAGIAAAKPSFHRKTILNALEHEKHPRTGRPVFPQAICSRMATGYPLMFNHLSVAELEKIAASELARVGGLFEKQFGTEVVFSREVPLCLVMREGPRSDARTIRSQAELFVKTEMFKLFGLYKPERLGKLIEEIGKISFELEKREERAAEIVELIEPDNRPKVMIAADEDVGKALAGGMPEVEAVVVSDAGEARNQLAIHEFDFALLDLWFGEEEEEQAGDLKTAMMFDYVPLAARSIHQGQELLRAIHERHAEVPCYLLSFSGPDHPAIDEDLLTACAGAGGARGVIEAPWPLSNADPEAMAQTAKTIAGIAQSLHREKKALELGNQSKIITFETAPLQHGNDWVVRMRNLRIGQALAADDVSEVVRDAERPTTRFDDVYGAAQAKVELEYIVRWMKDPKHYRALGLNPPRGILLYGPPGTGKTMLARALAGECEVTFIVESATNFVTKWVGSGPENVRNLFARARRYAPSIVFIDEIDAIGKKRSGDSSASRPQEETLNALLTEMDGFGAPTARPVVVIAATNLADHLDDALKRRFDREIEVDKPDRNARRTYLRKRLQGGGSREVSDEVLERLAGQSATMSIAELERIVQMAGRRAAMAGGVITDAIIEEAFETMRMGAARQRTDPETLLRVARHEAGHCLVGWLRGVKPVQVTIVARGHAGGYVEREAEEDRLLYTRGELEGMIRQAMGGRAAEIVYYGPDEGLSTGVSGDLKNAAFWAGRMVREFGMSDHLGHVSIDERRLYDGPLGREVAAAVDAIVRAQLEKAVEELTAHKEHLDRLVQELMEKNRLTREELERILLPV